MVFSDAFRGSKRFGGFSRCPKMLKSRVEDDWMDIFNQRHEGFQMVYPPVNVYITMERSTMLLMGKSTISMAISIAMLVHQRVARKNLDLWEAEDWLVVAAEIQGLLPIHNSIPFNSIFFGLGKYTIYYIQFHFWVEGMHIHLQTMLEFSSILVAGF